MLRNSYDSRVGEMDTFLRNAGKDISQLQSQIEADKRLRERMEQAPHGRGTLRQQVGFEFLVFRVEVEGQQCVV
jgi:hypothetical protein